MSHADYPHEILFRVVSIDHTISADDEFTNAGIVVLRDDSAEFRESPEPRDFCSNSTHHRLCCCWRILGDVVSNAAQVLPRNRREYYSGHSSIIWSISSRETSCPAASSASPRSIARRKYRV